MLFVGPQGAGANPGPACLRPGRHRADDHRCADRARSAAARPVCRRRGDARCARWPPRPSSKRVAGPLGISVEDAAAGMLELLEQHLLHAVQRLSIERGYDPRRFTLVAAGGAGPMHGASVGRMLNCHAVYVPRARRRLLRPGHAARQRPPRFRPSPSANARRERSGRARRCLSRPRGRGARGPDARAASKHATSAYRHEMDLRYLGQQWDVRVAVERRCRRTGEQLRASFEKEYERLFGHHQPDGIIEITQAASDRDRSAASARPGRERDGGPASRSPMNVGESILARAPAGAWRTSIAVVDLSPGHQLRRSADRRGGNDDVYSPAPRSSAGGCLRQLRHQPFQRRRVIHEA